MEKNNDGDTVLHKIFRHTNLPSSFDLILKESLQANIGGEFGLGGLFHTAREDIQSKIIDRWEEFLPDLQTVITELEQMQTEPPILHAAILANAPLRIITSIIENFHFSILKQDSLNRLPIQVAVLVDLEWNSGMREIIEATAARQHQPSIYVAARYGLKWNNGMSELAKSNANEVLDGIDDITGLRLFMLAAAGDVGGWSIDLSSVYGMMRMSPNQCYTCINVCSTN